MGTRALYDYVDGNPFFEFRQTGFVNSPAIIARNERMVSINSALQIDITGQVCSDSIGRRFYSGIGGQVDFIRGAAMSKGGKPIIALPSTAKGGTVSRIACQLDPGAGVVTSRGDVHYVVTEYGAAYLHGKTIRERAMALIEIAHPDFRAELAAEAGERRYVPVSWTLPTESERYPGDMEATRTFGEHELLVRPLRAADAERLRAFFFSHRPETVFGRYQYPKNLMTEEEALQLCTLDYAGRFAMAAFADAGKETIVGVARYTLNEQTSYAEMAVVVHESYRRLGIASFLIEQLERQAMRCGVKGFVGTFDPSNVAFTELQRSRGHRVAVTWQDASYSYELPKPMEASREPVET
jgi:GNAT superfamily N-acetyltransferase